MTKDIVDRFYSAYATGNTHTLRTEILAPDAVWHVTGDHPLAGTRHGADEIAAYFERLGEAEFRNDVLFREYTAPYVTEVHRCRSVDGTLDTLWVLFFRVEPGADGAGERITEIRKYPADQAQADAFFSRHYRCRKDFS
ncbi:nuclear transport factor 2 family protein [Streptomyces sp. SID14478]|uniref:nuclear transport factor 2 family protein n=1 Tax=Streptomyces sp. SID14478 TaxID=2706073 RepID=UPI0013DAA8AC|nr:nuclear transport factor 2 family protein [Streptomyces sp. SID14478]NEB79886.1 nuclear transport factor 2 family protein [Streptomyces sp. SID14478]